MPGGLVPDDSSPAEEQWSLKNGRLLGKASHSLAMQNVPRVATGNCTKAGSSHRCALAASDRAT